ncbi:hypothetical protein GBAR_LOCUS19132, partial [Geodia barretti]
ITRGGGSAVSLSLFDSVQDPLPSLLCLPEFRPVGPFAHSFETAGRVHRTSIAATGRIYPASPAGARHCHWSAQPASLDLDAICCLSLVRR